MKILSGLHFLPFSIIRSKDFEIVMLMLLLERSPGVTMNPPEK
jgi:hypothetical protein